MCCSKGFSQQISEHDLETSIFRDVRYIARKKVNIWLMIYQKRFIFIDKTKMGKFLYSPEECDFNELTAENDSTAGMRGLCSIYVLPVYCFNEQKQVPFHFLFCFNVFGEFTEILLYDDMTNISYGLYQDNTHCCNKKWFN
jgi:hypothetical protein